LKQLNRFRFTGSFLAHAFKAAFRQHHKYALDHLWHLIPPDGVVIDVGAHSGQYTKLYSKLAQRGHVLAFEPALYARAVLRTGLFFNRCKNVTVLPLALGDVEGIDLLSVPIKKSGAVGFGLSHLGAASDLAERYDIGYDVVPVTTLDRVVEILDLGRLDLIKLDTEGFELRGLRGAATAIGRYRPVILLEVNETSLARAGDSVSDFCSFMADHRYVCHAGRSDEDGRLVPIDCTVEGDLIFLPAERTEGN